MARPLVTTPLRSMLFTPGSNEKMVAKAPSSGADGALYDLEDSVAPAQKQKARELVAQAIPGLKKAPGAPLTTLVRVNAVETGMLEKDLEAVAVAGLDAIFLPKPESAADARTADAILTRLEKDRSLEAGGIGIILQIESAKGVVNCYEMCTAVPRVVGINFGSAEDADLCRDLGATWSPDGVTLLYARSKALTDARAAGMPHPTDGVYMRLDDEAGCRADAALARQLGYTGKAAIHPKQIAIFNEVFSPSPAEVDYYEGMMQALGEGTKAGLGAVTYKGKMVDVAMAKHAERVLARARTIKGR
ncbi:MAG: CoA ester lyase [Candidatus Tectomicrobia bacterium]|uniref:CoA ester lyase n=1 Tax=Tectimicrobiota bacterium TaxID=2528274 RepID=A0A932I3R1_UNCTE|nr:CoA ester lyase [Candidatus Tectomicrobia bacterium]